jgi:hypothetical protein
MPALGLLLSLLSSVLDICCGSHHLCGPAGINETEHDTSSQNELAAVVVVVVGIVANP